MALRRPRWRHVAALAAGFLVLWGPYTLWRVSYYGDFFSNTFYAKSGHLAWYSQGLIYAALYFQKYWVVALGLPLALAAWLRRRGGEPRHPAGAAVDDRGWREEVVLATGFAVVYTFLVVRVGGDFMYARFLIPVTPIYLVLLELGLTRLGAARGAAGALVAVAAAAGIIATPHPLPDHRSIRSGIVNEPTWYPEELCARLERQGRLMAEKYFRDLEVCMAFTGMQARLVYYARPWIAIETTTGLTDRFIARLPVTRRGRVGHEKVAPPGYLIDRRHADLIVHFFNPTLFERLGLAGYIPQQSIVLDDVGALLLRWEPGRVTELQRRGAHCADYPTQLDLQIGALSGMTDGRADSIYAETQRFYFDSTPDPAREAAFRRRLGHAPS